MLSERDLLILNALRKNCKISSRQLAKLVGLPISTVHRRVRRMEADGVISAYTASVDYEKVGKPVGLLMLIDIEEGREHIPIEKIQEALRKNGEMINLMVVHGENFDLVAKVRLDSIKSVTPFLERIRKIEGIEEVVSSLISQELM